MDSKNKGSFIGWNEVWKSEKDSAQINPYFDRGEPKTINTFWQQGYARDLLNLIKGKNYTKFCELGSGRGTTSMYLSDAGYDDITMIDLADQGFEVAKKSFPFYNLKTPKMILANVEDTGIEDESFDCIYNIGLLEHFEDPSLTLKEAYRLLKPGGMIFMPIMPQVSIASSYFARLLFHPISLIKILSKKMIGMQPSRDAENDILRTPFNKYDYIKITKGIGFQYILCLDYNPYWSINKKGWWFDNVVLPSYKFYYKKFKENKKISFQTNDCFGFCYLLNAIKA